MGLAGEDFAARIARSRGYRVLERRYRCRHGEIDLVAQEGSQIVFIEVKTRGTATGGRPSASVTSLKRSRMALVALHYLQANGGLDQTTRFDVVELWAENSTIRQVRWWKDAFRLTGGSY